MIIKIAFFSWDSFYGKLIRFGTKGKWTHCGIIASEDDNNYMIYEALNKGLVKNKYSKQGIDTHISNGKVCIKEINVPNLSNRAITKVCEDYMGRPYDWLSIINIICFIVFKKYALNFRGSRFLICSEFVARVLYDLGLNLSLQLNKPYDYLTPMDIYNYIKDNPAQLVNKSNLDNVVKKHKKFQVVNKK